MPRMGDSKFVTEQEHKDFMSLFPELIKDLTSLPEMQDMEDTNRWLQRVLEYNVPHGKRNRYAKRYFIFLFKVFSVT